MRLGPSCQVPAAQAIGVHALGAGQRGSPGKGFLGTQECSGSYLESVGGPGLAPGLLGAQRGAGSGEAAELTVRSGAVQARGHPFRRSVCVRQCPGDMPFCVFSPRNHFRN